MKVTRLRSKEPDVYVQLKTQKEEEQKRNRHTFLTVISCIRVLARQGLALRGHTEEEGILHQLIKDRAEDDKRKYN